MKTKLFLGVGLGCALFFLVWKMVPRHGQSQAVPPEITTNTPTRSGETAKVESASIAENAAASNQVLRLHTENVRLIKERWLNQNNRDQSFYGKVVDQAGQGVAGVTVTGILIGNTPDLAVYDSKTFHTQTDGDGMFQFEGLRGAELNVEVQKNGYRVAEKGAEVQMPAEGKPTPANRAVFHVWKLMGAEILMSRRIDAKIPYDGTPVTFDLATGKQIENGELKISLTRSPLQVRRGRDYFNWNAKIEIRGGGILQEADLYPYLAPVGNYQPYFEFNMNTNNTQWHPYSELDFYIKNEQGKYGWGRAIVFAGVTPARIQIDFSINPTGSRNLEPNFAK